MGLAPFQHRPSTSPLRTLHAGSTGRLTLISPSAVGVMASDATSVNCAESGLPTADGRQLPTVTLVAASELIHSDTLATTPASWIGVPLCSVHMAVPVAVVGKRDG